MILLLKIVQFIKRISKSEVNFPHMELISEVDVTLFDIKSVFIK